MKVEVEKTKTEVKAFRNYTSENNKNSQVEETYRLNHKYQTVKWVRDMLEKYCTKFDRYKMTIWDAVELSSKIVDESDPDMELPQIVHAFQTAEAVRKLYPDQDWMHLVGLIHDLGKVLTIFGLPQWSVVGDTFIVGCKPSDKVVFSHLFSDNEDYNSENNIYNTPHGIYSPHCGLDNVLFSFGHDEYLYRVCKNSGCTIPEEGLRIIRYHSFYAGHKENEYRHLMTEDDIKTMERCREFSKCDLYSKDNSIKEVKLDELRTYYDGLIKKYFPVEQLNF